MGKLSSLLWGAAIGAGMMYFMDPQNGERRKAMVRDQISSLRSNKNSAFEAAKDDLRNRARGIMAEGIAMVSKEGVPDYVLEERVRSRLGFLTRHPGAIQVSAHNGAVNLSGDVLTDEQDSLITGVHRVRGVKNVENNLRAHETAGNIPQLQGEGWMPGQNGSNWTPGTRLLAGIGAGYLFLYSIFRHGPIGLFARMGALFLGTRALTNLNMRQLSGMGAKEGAIQVRKGIQIHAPMNEVYDLWANFENFPRFMSNVESIRDMGNGRSHWVVKGPAGSKVEFDAITTQKVPNEVISWESTPDSMVKHQGHVHFSESGKGTQVNVNMAYTPPAGVAGHAVASLFGKDPKSEMNADLARMKSLLEEGKTTADSKTVRRQEVMPVTGSKGKGKESKKEDDQGDSEGNAGPLMPNDL